MKFRAVRWISDPENPSPVGPWQRRYGRALADARDDYAPFKRGLWAVQDSKGRVRLLGDSQLDRAIDEYHAAIAHRDAIGVWG